MQAIHDQPDPDKKLDLIDALKNKIMADGGMPEGATSRLLMMDLKPRYLRDDRKLSHFCLRPVVNT
ncbi:hypothetical protein ACFJIX_29505 [Roseateles sp. UC29_93]|uniref:hypothetical protein n=1 Tax=Roseateles sp. UC29_93 TaxID=3350177 RepID=UPI0036701BF5